MNRSGATAKIHLTISKRSKFRSKLVFEQGWSALSSFVMMHRQQRDDVRHRRFEIGNETLHPASKERVKDHGRNANRQSGTSIDQRLAYTFRKQGITGGAKIRPQCGKRPNDADGRA